MSTPDARLSPAERAALADLESAATAADPHLAARLRGRATSHARPALTTAKARALRVWAALLARGWWGAPLTVVGLFLAVLGLSTYLAISVLGLLVAATGLRLLAGLVERRLASAGHPSRPGRNRP